MLVRYRGVLYRVQSNPRKLYTMVDVDRGDRATFGKRYAKKALAPANVKRMIHALTVVSAKARMSPDLKFAVDEIITALKAKRYVLAAELAGVKSFISGSMITSPGALHAYHFREDGEYNEKHAGDSLYHLLDLISFDLSMAVDRMPAGMMVATPEGMKGATRNERHPTLRLMDEEERDSRAAYKT